MSKCFIVLGMHRSATSLVAQALARSIHFPCGPQAPTPDEPHGHYENAEMVQLNDAMLTAAGGSWHTPPPEAAILALQPCFAERIQDLVRRLQDGHELWGWKNPRSVLTLPLFLPYIEEPHLVAIFRPPLAVARSLQRRNHLPLARGLALAAEYNRRLQQLVAQHVAAPSAPPAPVDGRRSP